jgi:hypothetical protein
MMIGRELQTQSNMPKTQSNIQDNILPNTPSKQGVDSESVPGAIGNLALATPQLMGNILSFLIAKYIQIINLWFEKVLEQIGLSLGPETDWDTENEKSKIILKRIGNITVDVLQDPDFRKLLMEIKQELSTISNEIALPLLNEFLDVLQPIIDEQGNKLIETGSKGAETAIKKGIQSAVTAANAVPAVSAANLTANAVASAANAIGKSLEALVIAVETLIKVVEGIDSKGKAITAPLKKGIESFNRVKNLFEDTKRTIDSMTNKINSFNPNNMIADATAKATPQLPNTTPQLPNTTPQLPNTTPQLPNTTPQLTTKVGGNKRKSKKKRKKRKKRTKKRALKKKH